MRDGFGALKAGQLGLDRRMGRLEGRMEGLEDKYDKNFKVIREYLGHIDEEIQDLKKRLVAKTDLERLERLEQRLVQVELVIKRFNDAKES